MTGRKVWMLVIAAAVFLPSIATASSEAFQQKLNGFWIQEKVNTKGQKYTKEFAIYDNVWASIYDLWKNKEQTEKSITLKKFVFFKFSSVDANAATITFGDAKNDRVVTFLNPDEIEIEWSYYLSKEKHKTRLKRYKGSDYVVLLGELKYLNKTTPDQLMKTFLKTMCMNIWSDVELKKMSRSLGKDYRQNAEYQKENNTFRAQSSMLNAYGDSIEPYFDMSNQRQHGRIIMKTVMENASSSKPDEEVCNSVVDTIDGYTKYDITYERVVGPSLN